MRNNVVATALAVSALVVPAVAFGVWGTDQVDEAHPQVGAMYVDFDHSGGATVDELVCTGSFAGPSKDGDSDVFLTAGHCLPPPGSGFTADDLVVSFGSNAAVDLDDPVADPIAVTSFELMPEFGHDNGDFRDLGIVLVE